MIDPIKMTRVLFPLLVTVITLLPVQVTSCLAAEVANKSNSGKTSVVESPASTERVVGEKNVPEKTDEQQASKKSYSDEETLSTGMKIGIGVGIAAVVIGALAIGGSSGGGGSSSPPPEPTPPTADNLVSPWNAEGYSPGSGKTYTGTYHLYQGGRLGYDIFRSDGVHLIGSGSWRINGYTLSMNTDHGSRYIGDFTPGNTNTITLVANNSGWVTTLSR